MNLGELLRDTEVLELRGAELEVRSLAYDSRRAGADALFFAIQGEHADGHEFISQVLKQGAIGVVSELPPPSDFPAAWVRVRTIRRAMAEVSRCFFGQPDLRLTLVGITGTNGKTTTAYLVQSICEAAGLKTGLFGTIENRVGNRVIPALHTTPESLDLAGYLAELVRSGGQAAAVEVSSHALAQDRVWGFQFAAAVFTNLTGDHLDFHKDMEHYFAAKRRLFEGAGTPPPELAVINLDDPWGKLLLDAGNPRQITYAVESNAEVRARHFSQEPAGMKIALAIREDRFDIESSLIGRANVENILAAVAVADGLGIDREKIKEGVLRLKQVPGRFEKVDEGQPFLVIVDYAHTHDALRSALKTAREFTEGRLIVVFGCGGDRDRSKRPMMGEVAGNLSDWVVLTSDNPRTEDPILIMNDVMVGLQKSGRAYRAEVDREAAIRKALEQAREGDTVLIAGKGHESTQVLSDCSVLFDDRQVARSVLLKMGFHPIPGEPLPGSARS
ncbi:MAG: UDP-N-acetylmuramoyl-L-alanyl-D-glutamate--2,6-diaminopimelate ligase [Candidatus Acidiferrales bacterium]